jgi:hypothetical protein
MELTGLPLHGLIANIQNPKIVLTIIWDFVMRGNLYLSKGKVADLVLDLYKSLRFKVKRGTFKFPVKLLRRKLYSFGTMLRIAHGYCTYTEKRQFLG